MALWYGKMDLNRLTEVAKGTLVEHVGIEYLEAGDHDLKARMPVDRRTVQPYGILHGGASVVLAETLGSAAANCCVDRERERCVGLEINANHLRPVGSGYVYGTARPIHIGRRTQVWEIRIENEDGDLVCIARLTLAVTAL
ncbi:MAG TPA: hotdog fold thioesterase [Syntrophales bacterium]|nr:hotdog fold thioesterase [Syntrophales bacterium]